MIKNIFSRLIVIMIVISTVTGCTKKEPNLEAERTAVKNLVERYCQADFNGANLSTDNYKKSGLSTFVVAGKYMSPAWDTVTLIKGYSIKSVNVTGKAASVIVSFEVVGEVPGAIDLKIDKKLESYTFKLENKDGTWKLLEPYDLLPHISIDTAITHIQHLYDTQKNAQPKAPELLQRLKQIKSEL